jgi:predicted enzyme related to lactoylglutathione lyase
MTVSKFCWYELMWYGSATADAKAAEAFYGAVVGWGAEPARGAGDIPYTLFTQDGVPVAGFLAMPEEARERGARPHWVGFIGVDDVDAKAADVIAHGGRVLRPAADIPGVGRFAVVLDPDHAPFVLFRGSIGASPPPYDPAKAGHTGWHELYANDGEAAWDFYSDLFGWTKDRGYDMGALGIYQVFTTGDAPVGGMITRPPEVPAPYWNFYFRVEGAAAAVERIKAAGGKLIMGPVQVPNGEWVAQAFDPQGAVFAVVSTTP